MAGAGTDKRSTAPIWALSAAVAIAAAASAVALVAPAVPAGALQLPWWLLALAFAATELGVVHIHVRRSSHTLTLGEIPLVLGLLFAAPADVIAAWSLGAGAVLLARRELPAVRIAFNIALFGLTAGVAAATFHALTAPVAEPGPAAWAAAVAASVVSALAASGLVAAAMAISGEPPALGRLRAMLGEATAVAAVNAALGLAAAVVLAADTAAALLLLGPAVALVVAYRAYTAERNRTTSLEFLYAASRALSSAPDATAGLAGMLSMARETFRAEVAHVWRFASPETPGGQVTVDGEGRVEITETADPVVVDALRDALGDGPARRVETAEADGLLGDVLTRTGARRAMLALLPGERGPLGAMLVADRLGVGGAFSGEELRLFETLVHHTGAALGRDHLGRKISELREIQEELEHQAFHDPLTGLANRLLFMDRVKYALARRSGNAAVLYLDLDDFKPVNDTLGHEAGDRLLQEVAARLRHCLRAADTPTRLGGDEFAVLLVDILPEHARLVADRILRALAEPYDLGDSTARISASIGLALADSGAQGADELVRDADAAMYVAKHGSKHTVAVHGRSEGAERDVVETSR